MRDIKKAPTSSGGKGAAALRVILALFIGPAVCTGVYILLGKWFEYCGFTSAELSVFRKIWEYGGIPVTAAAVFAYIFRTLRRRYAYAYMRDYYERLAANGYTVCPRCGSTVSERTGSKTRSVHVGDRITTTHYSDGSKTTNTQAIYENRSFKYTYHMCDNAACGIDDDGGLKYGRMPYSRRDLRKLILGDEAATGRSAGYIVNARQGIRKVLTLFAVIAVAAVMLLAKSGNDSFYGQFGGREVKGISEDAVLSAEAEEYILRAREIISETDGYRLTAETKKPFIFGKKKSYEVYGWNNSDGTGCLTLRFSGLGTDKVTKGLFYIMPYSGQVCVFRDADTTIYPPDSDFYAENYDALAGLDGKKVMLSLLDRISTGELYLKKKTSTYVLRSEGICLLVTENGSVKILDTSGEKPVRYIFGAHKDTEEPHNYADFRLAGEDESETDPLKKLLKTGGYSAKIEYFAGGESVAVVRYEDRGNGVHLFKFDEQYSVYRKAEYRVFPDEDRFEVYPFDESKSVYADEPEKFAASDNREVYDGLVGMIPYNYVRANFVLDNAEKGKLLWATVYTYNVDGKKRSELMLEGGKVGKFVCYQTEDDYTEIRW